MRTQAEIEKELQELCIHLYFDAINDNLHSFALHMIQVHSIKEELILTMGLEKAIKIYAEYIMNIVNRLNFISENIRQVYNANN